MPTLSPRKFHTWAITACLLMLTGPAAAQDRYVRVAREHDRPRVFHEAVVLPGADAAQVVVAFRVPNSLLVFVQQEDGFAARPNVTVELYRGASAIEERTWVGGHEADSFEATQDDARDVEGRVVFELPPGRYAYTLSLADEVAGAIGSARRTQFVVPDFGRGVPGAPFFARLDTGSVVHIDLANLGGDVPFGARIPAVVPVASVEAGDRLGYRLYRVEGNLSSSDLEDEYTPRADDLIGEGSVPVDGAPTVGTIESGCTCWSASGNGRLIPVDFGAEQLDDGSYLLEVELARGDGSRHQARTAFRTLWRDMPLSLYDIDVAIRHLEYIEGRDRIREMLRGSSEARVEQFRAYWEARDPSPGTPFNELMAEYYGRIDVAANRFRTGRVPYPDGLRSDAASVYIVHGPPDDVDSSLPSDGGVVQIWTYPSGRQFVFWAASSLEPLELREERVVGPSNSGGS